MSVRISARLRMHIPAQKHRCEGAYPRALLEGLGFPMERIEDMAAREAEEADDGYGNGEDDKQGESQAEFKGDAAICQHVSPPLYFCD